MDNHLGTHFLDAVFDNFSEVFYTFNAISTWSRGIEKVMHFLLNYTCFR